MLRGAGWCRGLNFSAQFSVLMGMQIVPSPLIGWIICSVRGGNNCLCSWFVQIIGMVVLYFCISLPRFLPLHACQRVQVATPTIDMELQGVGWPRDKGWPPPLHQKHKQSIDSPHQATSCLQVAAKSLTGRARVVCYGTCWHWDGNPDNTSWMCYWYSSQEASSFKMTCQHTMI